MPSFNVSAVITMMSLGFLSSGHADSWTITQNVSVGANTEIEQSSSTGSVQAFNSINLDSTNGIVTEGEQSVVIGGNNLTLMQEDGGSNTQAVNLISAANVLDATQSLSHTNNVTLSQNGGTGNIQVVNAVIASGIGTQIESLTQNVAANTLTFNHQGGGNSNIQAGNYIEASTTNLTNNSIVQNFSVPTVNYIQNGTDNIQAGNLLIKNSGYTGGQVEQNFNVTTVNVSLPATLGNNSIAAGNYTIERN